jgi:hypothetical protein
MSHRKGRSGEGHPFGYLRALVFESGRSHLGYLSLFHITNNPGNIRIECFLSHEYENWGGGHIIK